ncbi:alpha/beta hydrolase family protein [Plesiocystis pacifica]|nr:alpha/beta hydrolase family protein [Plesiocystis pacifica]
MMASQLPVASMYPPPATPDRLLAAMTRGADRLLLMGLKRLFLSTAQFIDLDNADAILARLEPYIDPALIDDPERLFLLPEAPPRPSRVRRRPLYAPRNQGRGRVEVGVDEYQRYPTPYRPFARDYDEEYASYAALDTVHLYAWRHREPAPATLLLTHGWGVGPWVLHRHEYDVPFLFHRLGLDVYFYQAPFHGRRVPSQARAGGELHPSPDLVRTNEAFIQTIQELRGVLSLILERNPGAPVGMMGSSLGGYTSALLASVDERLDFVIPVLPPASFAHLLWDHGDGLELRELAIAAGMSRARFHEAWALHSPLSYAPKVPWNRRLIVTGLGDTLVTADHTRELWEHWDRPRSFRFPGGHAWQLRRQLYHREIGRFLTEIGVIR